MTELLLCIFRYCIFGYHCRRRMRGSLLGRVSFFLDRVKGFLELSFISAMREIFVIRVSIYSCMFPNKHGLKFSACSVYVFFASVVYALLIPKSCIFTNLPNLPHFRSDGISWPQWTPFRIRQSRLRNSRSIAIEMYSSIETEKQLRWADTIAQFAERFVWSCKWKTYFPWNAHSITGTTSTTNGWPQIDHRTRTTQRHHTKAIPSTNYVSVQPITHAFKDQRSHYSLLNKHTSVWVFSEHTGNDK